VSGFAYALFRTTSLALRAERLLRADGFTVRLYPTPRGLSKDCTLAIRCLAGEADQVRAALGRWGVECMGIHRL
jgi:hypothetical protein